MNFFYSINVNDRYRFPISVKEQKKEEQKKGTLPPSSSPITSNNDIHNQQDNVILFDNANNHTHKNMKKNKNKEEVHPNRAEQDEDHVEGLIQALKLSNIKKATTNTNTNTNVCKEEQKKKEEQENGERSFKHIKSNSREEEEELFKVMKSNSPTRPNNNKNNNKKKNNNNMNNNKDNNKKEEREREKEEREEEKEREKEEEREEEEEGLFEVFKRENMLSANCEKGLFCDEILAFLDAFFKHLKRHSPSSLDDLLASFSLYIKSHLAALHDLMKTMHVKQLIAPYVEVKVPLKIIEEFRGLDHGDPRAHLYQLNPVWGPAIKEFGFFLDRYESTKEVLCMFVWSTIDQAVVPMPAVGLNPYPLCWVCDKGFGTISCEKCNVAKYCSKECQLADWIRHGGPMCDLMASSLKKVKHLCFA